MTKRRDWDNIVGLLLRRNTTQFRKRVDVAGPERAEALLAVAEVANAARQVTESWDRLIRALAALEEE